MNETAQRKRGGRAYHSVLEPHFDFIQEQRRRRKTWKEIADLLFAEKGVRVTLYAPYHFYRRKLKRSARPHWEDHPGPGPKSSPEASTHSRSDLPAQRRAPLPPRNTFQRPNREQFNPDEFV